jgi:pimeloyl-ACP methyl ester carboxylesterase
MKRMWKIVGGIVGGLLAIVLVVAGGVYVGADLSRSPLDEAARLELSSSGQADTFVTTGQGMMHVRVSGDDDAPVVLLVHGGVVGGYGFENWREPLEDAGYRVVVPDLLGYGYSERPDVSYTTDFYTRQLHELLGGLDITEPVNIVGASLGGAIVTDFAAAYPEDIASLGLMAPSGLGPEQSVAPALMLPVIGDLAFRVVGASTVTEQMATAYEDSPVKDQMMAWMGEQSRYRGFGEGILNTLRNYDSIWTEDAYRGVGASGIPVFAAWGTEDVVHPYDRAELLSEWVPQAELLTLEGAGHAITYGRAQDVLAAYTPFLAEANAESVTR